MKTGPIQSPGHSEVLVKIHAVSLQLRDIMIAHDLYPVKLKENIIPGSDMAGEVVQSATIASFFMEYFFGDHSDETFLSALGGPVDGVLTEYRLFPAHSLAHFPAHLTYEDASTLPCVFVEPCAALTTYNALRGPAHLKGDDTVLVQGTGGVSMYDVAKRLGAKYLINYKTPPDWGKRGVNHIVEVGGNGFLLKSAQCIRYSGWIRNIGVVAEDDNITLLAQQLVVRAATLCAVAVGPRSMLGDMNRLISAIQLKPIVDKVFPFKELLEAYKYFAGQMHIGKFVVRVSAL
ncbi:GroES-like protein [Obba rivulosa]|uniref:GroES-like protein n=1 Tax=Obba rivulosa TaxID=1052685 RepID=A0A8E2DMB2_9APHY|nr:GroES-like protein [Obba rivulosa]